MKKFIIALFALVAFAATSSAQLTTTMTGSGDSIVNTGTKYLTVGLDGNVSAAAIQVTFTKTSGTAAGKATIEYSIDGTNYFRVNTDSLNVTNTTTQYKLWTLSLPASYKYARIKVVGSGTSRYTLTGIIYTRKQK
jgi:hypothetical protein